MNHNTVHTLYRTHVPGTFSLMRPEQASKEKNTLYLVQEKIRKRRKKTEKKYVNTMNTCFLTCPVRKHGLPKLPERLPRCERPLPALDVFNYVTILNVSCLSCRSCIMGVPVKHIFYLFSAFDPIDIFLPIHNVLFFFQALFCTR